MSSAEEKKCFLHHEAKEAEYKELAKGLKGKLDEIDNISYVFEYISDEHNTLNNCKGYDYSCGAIVDDFTAEMDIQISQYTNLRNTMETSIDKLRKKVEVVEGLREYHAKEKELADKRYEAALRKEEEERRRREEEE